MVKVPAQIAVVDDEESVRRALQRLIRSAGFAVEAYSSGEDFLVSIGIQRPSCVVLDIHMANVNGFDVQERLNRDWPGTPVVVITGHDSEETRARVMRAGAKAYLRKPIDAMVLLSAINSAIGDRPAKAE